MRRDTVRQRLLDLAVRRGPLGGWLGALALRSLLRPGRAPDRTPARLRVVVRGDGVRRRGRLTDDDGVVAVAPRPLGGAATPPVPLHHPPLEWVLLEDVTVSGHELVTQGPRALAGPDLERVLAVGGQLKGPRILRHRGRRLVVEASRPGRRVPVGVPLTGFGATNWYHWLVELLPKLQLLADAPDEFHAAPLIVPASAATGAAGEVLRLLAPDRDVVTVGRDEPILLERCCWLDSPVPGARTFRPGARPSVAALGVHVPTLARHRAALRRAVGLDGDGEQPEGGAPERLLLLRGRGRDVPDVDRIAEHLGLRPVDLGGMGAAEQLRLLARAEVVVGAWGAAWAGWLLTPRSARGLIWAPETFRTWPLYANLTLVGGRSLQHLFLPTPADDFRPANRARPDPTTGRLVDAVREAGLA